MSSGIYKFDTLNISGCDSVIFLDLTIQNSSSSSFETITICDSYLWNDSTYSLSGVYIDSSTNIEGCDSISTLNLIINYSDTSYSTVIACDSFLWYGVYRTQTAQYSLDGFTN